jgi:hypothetical protein
METCLNTAYQVHKASETSIVSTTVAAAGTTTTITATTAAATHIDVYVFGYLTTLSISTLYSVELG